MKSISILSAMISVLLMNEHRLNVKAECLPEGKCYYDISVDQTKRSECRKNGETWVYVYEGNNECEMEHFHSVFKSSSSNQCCNAEPEVVGAACDDVFDCIPYQGPQAEYCGTQGTCTLPNTCITNGIGNGATCFAQTDCSGACICDGLGGDQGHGICVPVGNIALESTQYTVSVYNYAGDTIDVGIFQTNPSDAEYTSKGALPIIFASQGISDNGQAAFQWQLEWGLSWSSGTTEDCTEFSDGIIYSQTGAVINVSPTDTGNNGALIHYDETNAVWSISRQPDSSLTDGLLLHTDDSFTNPDADKKCFTVCVTMNSNGQQTPVFAVPGAPNTDYSFKLSPKYFISRISAKAGETVSVQSSSLAYEIDFSDTNEVTLCINDKNQFADINSESCQASMKKDL